MAAHGRNPKARPMNRSSFACQIGTERRKVDGKLQGHGACMGQSSTPSTSPPQILA